MTAITAAFDIALNDELPALLATLRNHYCGRQDRPRLLALGLLVSRLFSWGPWHCRLSDPQGVCTLGLPPDQGARENFFDHRRWSQGSNGFAAPCKSGRRSLDLVIISPTPREWSESGTHLVGTKYLGDIDEIERVARREGITRLIAADDELDSKSIGWLLGISRGARLAVTWYRRIRRYWDPQTELNRIADVPMLDFHFSTPPRSTIAIKRGMDLIVSLFALTVMSRFSDRRDPDQTRFLGDRLLPSGADRQGW